MQDAPIEDRHLIAGMTRFEQHYPHVLSHLVQDLACKRAYRAGSAKASPESEVSAVQSAKFPDQPLGMLPSMSTSSIAPLGRFCMARSARDMMLKRVNYLGEYPVQSPLQDLEPMRLSRG